MTFSFISQATEVQVNWSCPQENYPGIPQLDAQKQVKVMMENGSVKFKPDPFKPTLLGDSFFRTINPLNKSKKSLAVDYSSCINEFVTNIQSKIPDYKEEWTRKIKNEIESKPFFAKSKDKKLLPTLLEYNKRYDFKYDQWRTHVENICEGKSTDYLGPDLLRHIGANARVTNSHPSKKCMDDIVKIVNEKIAKDEAEYCEYSEKICNNLKLTKANITKILEETKQKRSDAMKEAEEKFLKIMSQDNEAGFEDGFNSLFSKDPSHCAEYTTNISGPKGYGQTVKMHNLISKNLDKLMDHMDGSCQQRFIRQYMDSNYTSSLVGDWGIISYCKINETEFCTSLRDRFKIVDQNIERMLEKAYGDAGKEFYENVACEIEPGPQSLDNLLNQLKKFDQALSCRQLSVGDAIVVDSNSISTRSPTGISMRYSLERTGDKNLKARLNLNFKPNANVNVSANEMFTRVQSCMKELSPYFKGPDGEVLNIDIINSEEAKSLKSNQRPPKIDIAISGPNHRSNSGDYESDIDCPTIAHEVLHLMGLCDEYRETVNGNYYNPETGEVVPASSDGAKFINSANCRVLAKVPSIMSNQNTVIEAVVPKAPVCKCETADCKMFTKASKKLQDLYIKDPWAISTGRLNSEYCDYKSQGPQSISQYESQGELLTLNSDSDTSLDYTIRYWDDYHPKQVQNLKVTCACPSGDENCLSYLNQIRDDLKTGNIPQKQYCPGGSKTISRKVGVVDDSAGVVVNEDDGTFMFNGKTVDKTASLLHPQHFERIANGTCAEKAKPYSDCAQFAYRTDPSGKCLDVPKECQDPKYFLGAGNKQ